MDTSILAADEFGGYSSAELRQKVEQLRDMLIKWASNQITSEQGKSAKVDFRAKYNVLRQDIIEHADADIYHALPEAVRLYLGIPDFWDYVKEKCPDAKKRTKFLHAEFKPVLLRLDHADGNLSPPPDFSQLVSDNKMKDILNRRWRECQVCIQAGAHLAATVMMGGLLEGLFVARQNRMDKKLLIEAKTAPKDRKDNGKVKALDRWTLNDYIEVGHELGWITSSGRKVSAALRDYRNFIHPSQEYKDGAVISLHDTQIFWELTKTLAQQILATNPK